MTFERRILTTYDASTAGFDRGTRRVEQALARLQRTTEQRLSSIDQRFERAGRSALRAGTAIGAIIGVTTGAHVVLGIRNFAEGWRQVERSLVAAGFAAEGNQEKIAQMAIRARADLPTIGNVVSRIARATGGDLDAAIRRVETLQKLMAIGGSTTTEQASAILQFSQAIRANRLSGDEFRAISENAPTELLDALAKSAGAARSELKDLGSEGKLTAKVMLDALDSLATTADEKFAKLAISGGEAFRVLITGLTIYVGRMDKTLGVTAGLNEFLVEMGVLLEDSAEGAATFAKALEILAVAATGLAGAAGIGAVTRALEAMSTQRAAAVAATQAEVASIGSVIAAKKKEVAERRQNLLALKLEAQAQRTAIRTAVVAKGREITATTRGLRADERLAAQGATVGRGQGGRFVSLQTRIADRRANLVVLQAEAAALRESAASQRQREAADRRVANAKKALARAEHQLTEATKAGTAATNAMTIAQQRLSFTARALASVRAALSGVFAFFGGWPGLIFAAVTALVLFSDTLFKTGRAADRAAEGMDAIEDALGKFRSTQEKIEADTKALTLANVRLREAIEAQAPAAEATARLEVAAIRRRIEANKELAGVYAANARAQLAEVGVELETAKRQFIREAGRATDEELLRETTVPLSETDMEQRAAARLAAAQARQDAGLPPTGEDIEVLKLAAAYLELEQRYADLTEAVHELRKANEDAGAAAQKVVSLNDDQLAANAEVAAKIASLLQEAAAARQGPEALEAFQRTAERIAEKKSFLDGMADTVEKITDNADDQQRVMEVLATVWEKWKTALEGAARAAAAADISDQIGALDNETAALEKGAEAYAKFQREREADQARAEFIAAAERTLVQAYDDTTEGLAERARMLAVATQAYDENTASKEKNAKAEVLTEISLVINALANETKALQAGEKALQDYNDEVEETRVIDEWRARLSAVIDDNIELDAVLNALIASLRDNLEAQRQLAQETALQEVTDDLARMRAEALAMSDGEEALRKFREEGERTEYLDRAEEKLRAAGIEGRRLEDILYDLSGAWDDLREAVEALEFRSVFTGMQEEIAAITAETAAMQRAISEGNKEIFETFQTNASIAERVAAKEKELRAAAPDAGDPITATIIQEQVVSYEASLRKNEQVKAELDRRFERSRGGGRGRGGKSEEEKELERQQEAYEDLIESAEERQAQLQDEIALEEARGVAVELTRAHAIEMEFLAEKQRLMAEAKRADLEITAELTAEIEKHARAYAETAVELDDLAAARQILTEIAEEEMTIEERILAMRERTLQLLPALIKLLGDETSAREALAKIQERETREIYEAASAADEWGQALFRAVSSANSLNDAFRNMLNTFIELAATEFFNAMFGVEQQGKKGSGIFDVLGRIVGGAIGAYFGGGPTMVSMGANYPIPIASSPGFYPRASGGWTGGHRKQIRGYVHGEEYVVRAGPARAHLPLLEAINNAPGFAAGGFVSPSLPPIPITPTVPRLTASRASEMIDASMTINIDKPGATAEDIMRQLEPRLAMHQRETIGKIQRRNRFDPDFIV